MVTTGCEADHFRHFCHHIAVGIIESGLLSYYTSVAKVRDLVVNLDRKGFMPPIYKCRYEDEMNDRLRASKQSSENLTLKPTEITLE